ncbi:MAG: hypothetical protein BWY68_00400 [bacterium ADurb.Bin400]|nr:MAG: hypothetical protein BWY68_00400 [bacterium ADurb.Bin400]
MRANREGVPVVLVVEDDTWWLQEVLRALAARQVSSGIQFAVITAFDAFSVIQDWDKLAANGLAPDIILMDGTASGRDNAPQIHNIRGKGFNGSIIAMSLRQDTNETLVALGANCSIKRWRREKGHGHEKDKREAAVIAVALLKSAMRVGPDTALTCEEIDAISANKPEAPSLA